MATNHTDNHPQDLLAPVARDAQRSADPTCSTPRPEPLKTFDSQDLLQGADQIVIIHGEHEYRLRVTRNQKLILHK